MRNLKRSNISRDEYAKWRGRATPPRIKDPEAQRSTIARATSRIRTKVRFYHRHEQRVLSRPDVQEAMSDALAEYEAWERGPNA